MKFIRKLTKKKIAQSLQDQIGLNPEISKEVIEHVLELMKNTLNNGGTVIMSEIGTLKPVELEAGEIKGFRKTFEVGKRRKVRFIQSKTLEVTEARDPNPYKNLTPENSVEVEDIDPEVEEMRKIFSRLQ